MQKKNPVPIAGSFFGLPKGAEIAFLRTFLEKSVKTCTKKYYLPRREATEIFLVPRGSQTLILRSEGGGGWGSDRPTQPPICTNIFGHMVATQFWGISFCKHVSGPYSSSSGARGWGRGMHQEHRVGRCNGSAATPAEGPGRRRARRPKPTLQRRRSPNGGLLLARGGGSCASV